MSDDTDDLDEFARLFGAKPETPPEGLLPPVEARPAAPAMVPAAAGPAAADPLAWLLTPGPGAAPVEPAPPVAADTPTTMFPDAAAAFPVSTDPPTTVFPDAAAAFPVNPAADPTQALPTRRSIAAESAAASPDTSRRNVIILGSVAGVILILIIVLVFVLINRTGSVTPTAVTTHSDSSSASQSATPSTTPSTTPTPSDTPTPTPTPTPTSIHTVAPAPIEPTVQGTVSGPQPACPTGTTQSTFSIGFITSNTGDLTLTNPAGASSNVSVPTNGSGTIPSIPYDCTHPGGTYTLKAIGSDGTTPATAAITPTPTGS